MSRKTPEFATVWVHDVLIVSRPVAVPVACPRCKTDFRTPSALAEERLCTSEAFAHLEGEDTANDTADKDVTHAATTEISCLTCGTVVAKGLFRCGEGQ